MSDSDRKRNGMMSMTSKGEGCCNHPTLQDFHGFIGCFFCPDTEEDYASNAHHSSWCGVLEKESEL